MTLFVLFDDARRAADALSQLRGHALWIEPPNGQSYSIRLSVELARRSLVIDS